MTCHGFSVSTISTVILTCQSAHVPYYLAKEFFIVEKEEGCFKNILEEVLKQINASPLHHKDILLACKAVMT